MGGKTTYIRVCADKTTRVHLGCAAKSQGASWADCVLISPGSRLVIGVQLEKISKGGKLHSFKMIPTQGEGLMLKPATEIRLGGPLGNLTDRPSDTEGGGKCGPISRAGQPEGAP